MKSWQDAIVPKKQSAVIMNDIPGFSMIRKTIYVYDFLKKKIKTKCNTL